MSITESGRPSVRDSASMSRLIRVPLAPVQVIRMSAAPSSPRRSSRATARAPYSVASRSARPAVRLTTRIRAAPSRATVAVARPAIAPAPTTTTFLPATAPTASSERSSAALTSDGATWSMPVSARERLPTRSACWNSTLRAGPTVPISWPSRSASRVWPRIWPSPTAIESSPAATWNRWETAPSS